MCVLDIIEKKKNDNELSKEEISFFVSECCNGNVPDYQISAWLMAVHCRGMTFDEIFHLTQAMAASGSNIEIPNNVKYVIDKHSTGGVGDKTTLVVGPILAAAQCTFVKMSGRGLGYAGGTIDKLESIPGFIPERPYEKILSSVEHLGFSLFSQSDELVPADKLFYEIRDVSGTADSIPLIASSVMSKKLVINSNVIILDVKYGCGAFLETAQEAKSLAQLMVDIGEKSEKKTIAIVSNMNFPLGKAIGNSLEVIEAIETLKGHGPESLTTLCKEMAVLALVESGVVPDSNAARQLVNSIIISGAALDKFRDLIDYYGGDSKCIDDYSLFPSAAQRTSISAPVAGYITEIHADLIGKVSTLLGAGRLNKNDPIDYSAGVYLNKEIGQYVCCGEQIAEMHSNRVCMDKLSGYANEIKSAFVIEDKPSNTPPKMIGTTVTGPSGRGGA